jgi:hypothetical protein
MAVFATQISLYEDIEVFNFTRGAMKTVGERSESAVFSSTQSQ